MMILASDYGRLPTEGLEISKKIAYRPPLRGRHATLELISKLRTKVDGRELMPNGQHADYFSPPRFLPHP
jgi:hypothetical protein